MILYSLRKHFNPHTREISKSDKIKANEFSVCCTTVFKSENLQAQNKILIPHVMA